MMITQLTASHAGFSAARLAHSVTDTFGIRIALS